MVKDGDNEISCASDQCPFRHEKLRTKIVFSVSRMLGTRNCLQPKQAMLKRQDLFGKLWQRLPPSATRKTSLPHAMPRAAMTF